MLKSVFALVILLAVSVMLIVTVDYQGVHHQGHFITLEVAQSDFVNQPGTILHLQTEYGSDFEAIHDEMESVVNDWLQSHPLYTDEGILGEGRTLSEHGGYMTKRLVSRK